MGASHAMAEVLGNSAKFTREKVAVFLLFLFARKCLHEVTEGLFSALKLPTSVQAQNWSKYLVHVTSRIVIEFRSVSVGKFCYT